MYLNYGEPDSHTYIHETGHLLGLVDYYPTNVESDAPTFASDDSDVNVGIVSAEMIPTIAKATNISANV